MRITKTTYHVGNLNLFNLVFEQKAGKAYWVDLERPWKCTLKGLIFNRCWLSSAFYGYKTKNKLIAFLK